MARRAEAAAQRGFRRLKLKLGGRDGLDLERVRAVRAATDLPLQVDVNEYWTLDEALELLPQMPLEYCEQPLPAGDPDGPELKRRSPVPIYVDEDCHTLADVAPCAERAHGVNLKLAKSGGIREAVRMAHAARALGLGVMLGCMVESGLGIAAGAHIASLCDHVDLDGNLLLAHDPWPGVDLHGRRPAPLRPSRGSVSRERRLLILAEGYSARPAPRQDRARRHALPARSRSSRSSTRSGRGRRTRASRSSARSRRRCALGADDRARRRRDHRRPLPAGLARRCSTACIAAGLDIESGLHEFISDDPGARRARRPARRRAARPAQAARRA